MDFSAAYSDYFDQRLQQRDQLLRSNEGDENDESMGKEGRQKQKRPMLLLDGINDKSADEDVIRKALQSFAAMTKNASWTEPVVMNVADSGGDNASSNSTTISMPFLYADLISQTDIFVDKFYEDLTSYLRFDYENCCKLRPDPDESVFVSLVPTP